jgi:hypothetical protein
LLGLEGCGEKLLQRCNHRQSKQNYREERETLKYENTSKEESKTVKQKNGKGTKQRNVHFHVWDEGVCFGA